MRPQSRRQIHRLRVESLENRLMMHGESEMAFNPLDSDIARNAVSLQGTRLVVQGDVHANAIELSLSESGNQVEVRVDNLGPIRFQLSRVSSFEIRGRGGNDRIHVDLGLPGVIQGGDGNDRILGGSGAERILGGNGRDLLGGGPGADVVRGGFGADTLNGGAGADVVFGEAGRDRFAPNNSADRLPDLKAGTDTQLTGTTQVNRRPTATAQSSAVTVNGSASITLSGDDGDTNAQQTLTFRVQSLPTRGTLRDSAGAAVVVGANLPSAVVTYTPNSGVTGADSFTFLVQDNGGTAGGGQDTSEAATVSLTVAANRAPTATAQTTSTQPNTEKSITLAGDDGDPDVTQTLSFRVQTLPTSGTLRNSAGATITAGATLPSATVTYTPNASFTGSDSFTFVAMDNGGTAGGGQDTSPPATVSLTVSSANQRPTANSQPASTTQNTATTITLTGDDGDAEATQTLSFRVQTLPTNGTLRTSTGVVVQTGVTLPSAMVSYTPNTGFTGNDSFTFIVIDNGGTGGGGQDTSTAATISIRVSATNTPFAAVTTGSFQDSGLLGMRTDQQTDSPAITSAHLTTAIDYSAYSNPPTYGPHHGPINDNQGSSLTPRPTGVYATPQPDEDLVHNLEHGHVWISYNPNLISSSDLASLEQFVRDGGTNTGVILTPRSKNTSVIAAASWARLLTLDRFDATQLRNMINSNRGHAPEQFIPSGQRPTSADPALDGLPHTP